MSRLPLSLMLMLMLVVSVRAAGPEALVGAGPGALAASAPAATDSASATSPASPGPTPGKPSPSRVPTTAWTIGPIALLTEPGDEKTAIAYVGAGFPLSPTSVTTHVLADRWLEVVWETPGRRGIAWVPESALTFRDPGAVAQAAIDALDTDLAAYLSGLGDRIGVEVRDITRGAVYDYNETHQYTTASSVKVPIMLAFLARLETDGREPTARERSLLTTMIENSRDASATELWDEIGGAAGLSAFMARIGVSGLSPYVGGWSWSTISPHAMVHLLTLLHDGSILNDEHRALALYLMGHVQSSQRIGVGDTAPAGATVAMKIGRWWYDAKRGGTVMSSSGIVTYGDETYVISVYTDRNRSMPQAEATVRHVCSSVATLLLGDSMVASAMP